MRKWVDEKMADSTKRCELCSHETGKKSEYHQCTDINCGHYFHTKCMEKDPRYKKTLSVPKYKWICISCAMENASKNDSQQNDNKDGGGGASGDPPPSLSEVAQAILELKKVTCDQHKIIKNQEKIIANLTQKVQQMEYRFTNLEEAVADMDFRISVGEQEKLQDSVVISGTTAKDDEVEEDLTEMVCKLASAARCEVSEEDIVECRRFKPKPNSESGSPTVVMVKFASPEIRDKLVANCKQAHKDKAPITTDKIQLPGTPQKIYVNPMMTKANKELYDETRRLLATKNYCKFVWFKYNKIWAKVDEDSKAILIKSRHHLSEIYNDMY